MERVLAALVALLEALKPLFSTLGAFLAGKGVAEYRAMEMQLEREKQHREFTSEIDALHSALDDDGVRELAIERIKWMRLKARAADRGGGNDD